MPVEWSYMDECAANPDYELTGKAFGEYVDVIGTPGPWSVMFAGKFVAHDIETRDAAQQWAETNLSTQAGMIAALKNS